MSKLLSSVLIKMEGEEIRRLTFTTNKICAGSGNPST